MVQVNSGSLTARMAHLLESAYVAAGIPKSDVVVTQGSYHHGSASGSTHDGGGAADLRVWNLPSGESKNLYADLITRLRERNACAWYRDQQHGGFDPHIHLIVRDEPGLSTGAKSQVRDYDQKQDGLSGHGPDYHPRPTQHPIEWWDQEDDVALTDAEIQKIADAVWNKAIKSSWSGSNQSAAAMLAQANFYAIMGGQFGAVPAGGAYPGNKSTSQTLRDEINQIPTTGTPGTATDPQVIADAVADEMAQRMKE